MLDIMEGMELMDGFDRGEKLDERDELDDSNSTSRCSSESGYEEEENCRKAIVGHHRLPSPCEKELHMRVKMKKMAEYADVDAEIQLKVKKKKVEEYHYADVGEDIHVTISKPTGTEVGITLICGEVFTPSWPAIIDIKRHSPASEEDLKIGDQIKELAGIDTNTLTHWQLVALFSKTETQIRMTVRRGIDRSQTTFDWYKHPFSSVRQDFEELVIRDVKGDSPLHRGRCPCCQGCNEKSRGRMPLRTFKIEDDLNAINEQHDVRHIRSLSASSTSKAAYSNGIERRRRHTNHIMPANFRRNASPVDDGKLISNEIERMYAQKAHLDVIRQSLCDSSYSVASTLSDSTASSFSSSSSTTYSDQVAGNQSNWMDHVINSTSDPCNYNDELFDKTFDKTAESTRSVSKSPGAKLRESFRRKKSKKETNVKSPVDDTRYTLKCKDSADNTLLITVWVIDRRKFGLQLGGGSVSAYGDSNVKVSDVRKTGTAYKIFRAGDELLEIGGVTTNGLNVYEVNRMISNLEGQYAEFKIFRPKIC